MKCPADGTELTMTERQGIEIDYCPQCRGVWLDRGELDRIIERSASFTSPGRGERELGLDERDRSRGYSEERRIHDSDDRYRDDDGKHYEKGYDPRYGKRWKRKSFLGDLFDFD